MACANANAADIDEDKVERQLGHLVSVFPETDPEFLHRKVIEFADKEAEFAAWIDATLEKGVDDLPTRKDYEKRLKVIIIYCFIFAKSCLMPYNQWSFQIFVFYFF
jgi:hypothetical protein